MSDSLIKPEDQSHEKIRKLETEIAQLENALAQAETGLNIFTAQLRAALMPEILRIQELTAIYKKLKADKKAKRLEQKKKGKNYREPQALKQTGKKLSAIHKNTPEAQQELKNLYKEAIRHIHPDKFAGENAETADRATEVTMQLNAFYESGDVEELKGFYEYIISGNAMAHVPYQPETAPDPDALLQYLQKKHLELSHALQAIVTSELYHVLHTFPDPLTFIPELRLQFQAKIQQLQKRTRKAKP